jgi:hypothetical protein
MATVQTAQLVRIGDGPIATIYSGHHSGVAVAYKVFPKRFDKKTMSALAKEQATLSGLRRIPSILPVDAVDELPTGQPALRMELCASSLARVVERDGPMTAPEVMALGRAVALALSAAHEAGVVHGGMSPHNVLFRASGAPAVSDFGLTLREASARDPLHAIEFLPPETLRTGVLNESTDLYGLGALLHFALAGRTPHPGRLGEQPGERVLRILGEPVPALNARDVPVPLTTLVARLLAVDPAHRPAEAAAVADRLGALLPDPPPRPTDQFDDFAAPPPPTHREFDDFASPARPDGGPRGGRPVAVPGRRPVVPTPPPVAAPAPGVALTPRPQRPIETAVPTVASPAGAGKSHRAEPGARAALAAVGQPPAAGPVATPDSDEVWTGAPPPGPSTVDRPPPAARHRPAAAVDEAAGESLVAHRTPTSQAADRARPPQPPAPKTETHQPLAPHAGQQPAPGLAQPQVARAPAPDRVHPRPPAPGQPPPAATEPARHHSVAPRADAKPAAPAPAIAGPTTADRPSSTDGMAAALAPNEPAVPGVAVRATSSTPPVTTTARPESGHATDERAHHQPTADARQPTAEPAAVGPAAVETAAAETAAAEPEAAEPEAGEPEAAGQALAEAAPATSAPSLADLVEPFHVGSTRDTSAADGESRDSGQNDFGGFAVVQPEATAEGRARPWGTILTGAVLAVGVVVFLLVLLLGDEPQVLPDDATRPTAAPPPTDVPIELAPPVDRGTTVELRWRSTRRLDYGVSVAVEGEEAETRIAGRRTSMTVTVDPDRRYCFQVQGTDQGDVYESRRVSVRGAVCRE